MTTKKNHYFNPREEETNSELPLLFFCQISDHVIRGKRADYVFAERYANIFLPRAIVDNSEILADLKGF